MNIAIHFFLLMVGITTLCFGAVEFVLLALFSTTPWYAVYCVIQMYLSTWFSMRMINHLKCCLIERARQRWLYQFVGSTN